MSDWWAPLLFIALLLWVFRSKWLGYLPKINVGVPPHQPSQRFQDYDEAKRLKEEREQIDRILEKIAEQGMDCLSPKEKLLLEEAAKREKQRI